MNVMIIFTILTCGWLIWYIGRELNMTYNSFLYSSNNDKIEAMYRTVRNCGLSIAVFVIAVTFFMVIVVDLLNKAIDFR